MDVKQKIKFLAYYIKAKISYNNIKKAQEVGLFYFTNPIDNAHREFYVRFVLYSNRKLVGLILLEL